tara:strand:+ start:159 stop:515 length:357 start_codon:yes stop_codon:yes gene_type:complete
MILGIMIFFSFVVAPVAFSSLDKESYSVFIRKIFPYYYLINLALSLVVFFIFIYLNIFEIKFYLISLTAILFFISNYLLMPLINKYSDQNLHQKFKYSHLLSVILNFIQMFCLIFILI